MKKLTEIKFGQPRYIQNMQTLVDGTDIYYPYELIKKEANSEELEIIPCGIKVSITGSMSVGLGFQIWQKPITYDNLMKLLLEDTINVLKNRFKNGMLKNMDEVLLRDVNHQNKTNFDDLPSVEGYEVSLE